MGTTMYTATSDQDMQLAVTLMHMRHGPTNPCPEPMSASSWVSTSMTPTSSPRSLSPPPSSPIAMSACGKTVTVSSPVTTPYTPEQRRIAIHRYLEKKHRRRSATDRIRYQVRKKIAHARPRFRGRFSKPSSSSIPNWLLTPTMVTLIVSFTCPENSPVRAWCITSL